MDALEQNTLNTYNKISVDWAAKRRQGEDKVWEAERQKFQTLLPRGKVLDIGCGPGADSFWFLDHDYEYLGIDGSESMIKLARENNPQVKFEVKNFDELSELKEKFNGFWAAASLLPVPKQKISEVLINIKQILLPQGIGFIALKEGEGEKNEIWGESGLTRFFAYYTKEEFSAILTSQQFRIIDFDRHISPRDNKTVWLIFFVKI